MSLEGLQLGQYRLQRLLGTGGMGEVYLAEDPRIGQQVAIKVSRTEVSAYPNSANAQEAIRLFQREAKAIARLDHPYILPLFGYGEENVQGVTCTYLVMPFRREGSLADWLSQRNEQGLIAPQDVASFIFQAADALQYAHDNQIIHQDVKPSNFLLRGNREHPQRPDLLLADFGIARLSSATSSMSHTVRGTPTYMAPEQWSGEPVPATDQYALAVMAYELLTGRAPFTGRQEQVMYQHFQVEPRHPSALNPRLPSAVDSVLLRALAKKPGDRFPSINDFARALLQALSTTSATYAAPVPPSSPIPSYVPLSTANPSFAPPSAAISTHKDTTIRATLAISKAEAQQGTTRTLTLPGGRKVSISIPMGAYDGQMLYLNGQDGSPNSNGHGDSLVLTLTVTQAEEQPHLPVNPESNAQTARASNTPGFSRTVYEPNSSSDQSELSSTAAASLSNSHDLDPTLAVSGSAGATKTVLASKPDGVRQDVSKTHLEAKRSLTRRQPQILRAVLLGVLAVLVIGGSIYGLIAYQNHVKQLNDQATASAVTATVVAANPDPYSQKFGTLATYDPLDSEFDNSPYYWSGDNCTYTGSAFHVSQITTDHFTACSMYDDSNYSVYDNFVYEAQMTIIQGDCGGLQFRFDSSAGTSYDFVVCQDGTYYLYYNPGNNKSGSAVISQTSSPAIHTGLNQSNTVAVMADGSSFTVYVNSESVGTATDSASNTGEIGVIAYDTSSDATEVAYSKVRVWTT